MPLISIVRFFFTIVSLAILGTAGWLLWSWYHGNVYRTVDGSFHVLRQDWRLWLGALFLLWSLLGRFLWVPLLSHRDTKEPSRPERTEGRMVEVAGGSSVYVEIAGPAKAPTVVLTHGWGMD